MGVLGLHEGYSHPPAALSGALALTENQSTWLKLPWEWEGPHLRRAVPPTSTSTSSGSGCSASPGTPEGEGGGTLQQLCQLQLLSIPSPHCSCSSCHFKGLKRTLSSLNPQSTLYPLPWASLLPVQGSWDGHLWSLKQRP